MKHPIPFKYRLLRKYGCNPQPFDSRDIKLGDTPYTPDPKCPSWEEGFDNEVKYGKLTREHQGSSKSCVGQGWSKYAEMINQIEEGFKDLSARFIYAQIHLPNGGAYIRNGADIIVKQGVSPESLCSSYNDGSNPNEDFMRLDYDIPQARSKALQYKAKKYVWIDADTITDDMRQVIYQYGGFVSGYHHHCMYASAYGVQNGKKFINFVNSYGEGSDHKYFEDDGRRLYDITFLMDLPNDWQKPQNMKLIKQSQDAKTVYAVVDNIRYWILDPDTLQKGKDIWGVWGTIHIDDPNKYKYGGAIFISGTDDPESR